MKIVSTILLFSSLISAAAPSIDARYVRIELPGKNRVLTLAEVEILWQWDWLTDRAGHSLTRSMQNPCGPNILKGAEIFNNFIGVKQVNSGV